jgi:hypothetical protein
MPYADPEQQRLYNKMNMKRWRERHPESWHTYYEHHKEKEKLRTRLRHMKNRGWFAAYWRQRRQNNPETDHVRQLKYSKANPEKRRAKDIVHQAVRTGKLLRQLCEICNTKAHGHHDDYTKPLDLRWLCSIHHWKTHNICTPSLSQLIQAA